jgi:hypothetical protein
MKVLVITLALAGLASTTKLDAQILGRPLPSTNTSANVDGSWRVVGRDGSGNTIYERRTQDRNGNILVQRAVRDSRGNMSVISSSTINNGTYNNGNNNGTYNPNSNCSYNQSTNSVGDIIFGRSGSNVNCTDNGSRVDGGWYQVGQGRNNNSVYERRVTDRNGNLVIQRARRNPNGSFTIISSRAYNSNNDKQWQKAQQRQQRDMRKQQQQQDKQYNKSQRDQNDNNPPVAGADDRSYVATNADVQGNGHGKGNGKGKHKGND